MENSMMLKVVYVNEKLFSVDSSIISTRKVHENYVTMVTQSYQIS